MNLPIPAAGVAVADVGPIGSDLYAAFESAAQETREFFERIGERPDVFLYSPMIRYYVKRYLDREGHPTSFERDEIANNGLCISYNAPSGRKYKIRMLRADNGQLPAAGKSQAKQNFFNQDQLAFAFMKNHREGTDLLDATVNLVVLWEVTVNYNFWDLKLCCPQTGSTSRRLTLAYWTKRLPHPAEVARPADDHDGDDDAGDVGFQLPQDQTGTDATADDRE